MENPSTTYDNFVTLRNGYKMPLLGIGTFLSEGTEKTVYEAIKCGLRLIDTAARYLNEKQVGQGISQAISEGLVKREDLFVVTKLWVGDKEDPEAAMKKSLNELNLDYVDLYLDHWPMQIFEWEGKSYSIPTHVVYKKMEDLVKKGYTKSIGLSNYNVQRIMDVLSYAEIPPAVLQVELNPYLTQENLIKFCRGENIAVMVFNSLCRNKYVDRFHKEENLNLLEEDLVKSLAVKYEKTPGQIAISWAVSQGLVAIPGTSNPERLKENAQVLNFRLSKDDVDLLSSLNRNARCNESMQWDFFKKIDLFA